MNSAPGMPSPNRSSRSKDPSPAEIAWNKNRERLLGKINDAIETQYQAQGHKLPTVAMEKLQKGEDMQRLYEDLYMASPAKELRLPATPEDPEYMRAKIIDDKTVLLWGEDGTFHKGVWLESYFSWAKNASRLLSEELKQLSAERENYRDQIGGQESSDQELLKKMEELRVRIAEKEADLMHVREAARELGAFSAEKEIEEKKAA